MYTPIATESLVQRGKSPFYLDIVNLYQDTQKALEGLKSPSSGDVLMMLKSERYRERLKAIVQKHMNIVLKRVTVVDSPMINMMVQMGFSDAGIKLADKEHNTPGSLLDKIGRLYNHRLGKMEHPSGPKSSIPYDFEFTIYTSMWVIRDDTGAFFFTPEELAAVTLHEFGHIDHFIRAAYRIYGRTLDAADIVDYIQRQPNPDVLAQLLSSLKTSAFLGRDYDKTISVTETYFKTNNALDDPSYYEALNTLITLVVIESAAYQLFQFDHLLGGGRDRMSSHIQEVDTERSADEFSSRHGAYSALVTALGKMYSTDEDKNYLALRQFLWRGPALILGTATHFLSIFKISREDVVSGYDPLMRRMSLIIETAKHAFHDLDLAPDIKNNIHQQITDAEAYIAQYSTAPHRRMRMAFKEWRDNVGKLGRILKSPIDNRLSADYGRLQDSTRALTRHSLYYLSSQ